MAITTVISGVLAADVVASGTFTVTLPTGSTAGHFTGGVNHALVLAQSNLNRPTQFTISFSGSSATITNATSATWAAGSAYTIELDQVGLKGFKDARTGFAPLNTVELKPLIITLGSPATLSSAAICSLATLTSASAATLSSAAIAAFDVPRNVVGAWTSAASNSLTVAGLDVLGVAMTETLTGTNGAAGKKAFASVTSVTCAAANLSAVAVGTGDVLGLPVALPYIGAVVKELEDGIAATAGTVVKADQTKATATTGDVRGTYDPNSACNGAKSFQLCVLLPDPGYTGVTQA